MATTAVFAEILIVGLQAEVVLGLVVLAFFGDDWIRLDPLQDWTSLVTVLVLAAAYVLGILVDCLADSAAGAVRDRRLGMWLNDRFGESSRTYALARPEAEMRLRVLAEGGSLSAFLEYQRSRLRIARGTVLTSLAALPAGAAFLVRLSVDLPRGAFVLALVLVFFMWSVVVAERIHSAYMKRLADAYALLSDRDAARP